MQFEDRPKRARLSDVLEVRESHQGLTARCGQLEEQVAALRAEIAERSADGWRRVPMSPEEFAARGVLQFLASSPSAVGKARIFTNGIGDAYERYLDGIKRIYARLAENKAKAEPEPVAAQ